LSLGPRRECLVSEEIGDGTPEAFPEEIIAKLPEAEVLQVQGMHPRWSHVG
jgi:hypothetical protein